jgi:hypothetical protein
MKRKSDALGGVITKHMKCESDPLDLHVIECISKLLTDVDFGALMAVSRHVYQGLKAQRLARIFRDNKDPDGMTLRICKAYRAVKDGLQSVENFGAWLNRNEALGYDGLDYIYQATFGCRTRSWQCTAYNVLDYLKISEQDGARVLEWAWHHCMHEDDIATVVHRIIEQHPDENLLNDLLAMMATWQYSPKILSFIKLQCASLTKVCTGFKSFTAHHITCPDPFYLDSVTSIVPSLPVFILGKKRHIELHRYIASRPTLLAYFAKSHRVRTLKILYAINEPIPETFLFSRYEIAAFMLSRDSDRCHDNMHMWNYALVEPTIELFDWFLFTTKSWLRNRLTPECTWACLELVVASNASGLGHVDSIAEMLESYIWQPGFNAQFLRCFNGADYRELVIRLWPDPPNELLCLVLPYSISSPKEVIFYEAKRLELKLAMMK